MPVSNRPRERLRTVGVHALTDEELLAILLGSGIARKDVLQISKELLPFVDRNWERLSSEQLEEIKGIGSAKASVIVAALEFARRRIRPAGIRVREAKDVLPLVGHLQDRMQEHFICIALNGAHEVIATRTVTIGLVNSSQVHPREVFSDPLKDRATSVIVCHNHPSGNLEPSGADKEVTKVLQRAGEVLGIRLLDHIIFSSLGFLSFKESGLM